MLITFAAPFYASDTFWTAAAAIVALFALGGTVWATLRAANPKRQLTYRMTDTRLVQTHHSVGVLQISRDGVTLTDPRVVRIQLANPGRRDIAAASFDGRPIQVGIGQPILDLLSSTATPETSAPPVGEVNDTKLLISPGRIGRSEAVSYVLLIDGQPSYDLKHSLVDVTVKESDASGRRSFWKSPLWWSFLAATAGAVAVAALVSTVIEGPGNLFEPRPTPTVYIPVTVTPTATTPPGHTGSSMMPRPSTTTSE